MKLLSFDVLGYRSLEDVAGFTLGRPAILTGENDGGKTAMIGALRFLLKGTALAEDDRTFAVADGSNEEDERTPRIDESMVTGLFDLSPEEASEFELPNQIELRRRSRDGGAATLEIRRAVPSDESLRNLEAQKLPQLKQTAAMKGVQKEGPGNHRESWLNPLMLLASQEAHVEEWVRAPRDVERSLPMFVEFTSTDVPNPELDATRALRSAFEAAVKSDERVGRLRDLEDEVRAEVVKEAQALTDHVRNRCPDLSQLIIEPQVSFNEGFRGVTMLAATEAGEAVTLLSAGAGRMRRITLAVWEWTTRLLDEAAFASGVVIAYDEPDTHLDYRHQRDLMDLIHAQCLKPHVQMIVATHSMNLIDRVDIADVQHLSLTGGRSTLTRLVDPSHDGIDVFLSDVASAMGLRNSVLLHERCFVAVEGPTESQALPILFRAATGMTLQAAGIALVACNGNQGALHLAQFLHERDRQVAFIVDNDSKSNRATRKLFRLDRLQSHGFTQAQVHYVGDPLELEDIFTDQQWAAAGNLLWKRKDECSWEPADIHKLRSGGKFSEELKEMFKVASPTGPMSKPEMVTGLASTLREVRDVPEQMREIFDSLTELGRS